MKQRRLPNGKFRVNYTERFMPVYFMLLTVGFGWGLQTGNRLKIEQAQARSEYNAGWVDTANTTRLTPTPIPTVVPTNTPTPKKTEKEQIIDYIVEVFGEEAPNAFNVLYCENRGLNPKAVNYNRNGSRDLGIFQLNDQYWGGDENFDWKTNIDKAHKIFKKGGWKQWACSERVDIKPFWKE